MTSIYSDDYQLVIAMLKNARKARGITQVQLSVALGRPQSFVAKAENGERRLDIIEFIHLARLVGLDPASVIDKFYLRYSPLKPLN